MRSGTGNAAIVLPFQSVIDVARSFIDSRFAHLIIALLIPFSVEFSSRLIAAASRRSISNLILLLGRWGVIMNDVNFAAVLKLKFSSPPIYGSCKLNSWNIIIHQDRLPFTRNFNVCKIFKVCRANLYKFLIIYFQKLWETCNWYLIWLHFIIHIYI